MRRENTMVYSTVCTLYYDVALTVPEFRCARLKNLQSEGISHDAFEHVTPLRPRRHHPTTRAHPSSLMPSVQ